MFVLYQALVLAFITASVFCVKKMLSHQKVIFNTDADTSVFVEVDYTTSHSYIVSWPQSKIQGCLDAYPERFRVYSYIDDDDKDSLMTQRYKRYSHSLSKLKEYAIISVIFALGTSALVALSPFYLH